MRFALILVLVLVAALASQAQESEEVIEFYPEVIFSLEDGPYTAEDGDSFWIGYHRVRLHGIDTIEADQPCWKGTEVEASRANGDCHRQTMNYLETQLQMPDFKCRMHLGDSGLPRMSHSRYVVTCFIGEIELNRKMVMDGWAVAAKDRDGAGYRNAEMIATARRKGLHKYNFTHPKNFRNPEEDKNDSCPT